MLVGYVRVSTADERQSTDLQRDALRAVGVDERHVYEDKASGGRDDRPGLKACLEYVKAGDVLVVWRLDRLGRSIRDLIEWVHWLEQEGAGLKSLQEAIDTTSTGGKLTFHIFAALAEFERQLIQERTHAGLQAARARGRLGGRPKALSASKQQRAVELYQEKRLAVQDICKIMGISKPTLYAYVRQAQSVP
jgi:DNA invertase Pin-like site-specific DNA recombinase